MVDVAELDECRAEIKGDMYSRHRTRGSRSGGDGGSMDDVLKRLGAVEASVSEIKVQVGAIVAVMPSLATKSDVNALRAEVNAIAAVIPHFATKADIGDLRTEMRGAIGDLRAEMRGAVGELRAEMRTLETRHIKWLIGTVIATTSLAFTIAKFVH